MTKNPKRRGIQTDETEIRKDESSGGGGRGGDPIRETENTKEDEDELLEGGRVEGGNPREETD